MTFHKQSFCTTQQGEKILVDEKLSTFIQMLWDAGIKTWTSCQWEGPSEKKYPAYINPCIPVDSGISAYDWSTPEEMASILGLER